MRSTKARAALVTTLAAAAALGVGMAFAQSGGDASGGGSAEGPMSGGMRGMPGAIFEEMDVNKDGTVTIEEFRTFRSQGTSGVDADGNGTISQAEMIAFEVQKATERATKLAERRFAERDLDGNGELTVEELLVPSRPSRLFGFADADGDGAVTRAEFDSAVVRMQERMGRAHGRGMGHDMDAEGMMPPMGLPPSDEGQP